MILIENKIRSDVARHARQPQAQGGPRSPRRSRRRDGAWRAAPRPALRRPARTAAAVGGASTAAPADHDGGTRAPLPTGRPRTPCLTLLGHPRLAARAEPDGPRPACQRLGRDFHESQPRHWVARRICPHTRGVVKLFLGFFRMNVDVPRGDDSKRPDFGGGRDELLNQKITTLFFASCSVCLVCCPRLMFVCHLALVYPALD